MIYQSLQPSAGFSRQLEKKAVKTGEIDRLLNSRVFFQLRGDGGREKEIEMEKIIGSRKKNSKIREERESKWSYVVKTAQQTSSGTADVLSLNIDIFTADLRVT